MPSQPEARDKLRMKRQYCIDLVRVRFASTLVSIIALPMTVIAIFVSGKNETKEPHRLTENKRWNPYRARLGS